ncbi:MAG: Uma2 family endonuclease [Chloroflexota bacterium]
MASMPIQPLKTEIVYPERDGKPMSDNTKQFRWLYLIEKGLESLFENNPAVFVAGNLLWYPVEGKPKIRAAPDAMVIFGRPKGDRGSYRQWEEENIAPQVAFEILSPGNDLTEMNLKRAFYERYGVEEYYIYDPDSLKLTGWIRRGRRLEPIAQMKGWKSSLLLDLRFELDGLDGELKLHRSDGKPFSTDEQLKEAEKRAAQAEQRAAQAEQHAKQAEQRAKQAEQRVRQERQERQEAEQRAEKLLARLRAEGINLDDL